MSLDDKLRQGMQTLDEPENDPARALQKFRTTAYPRRARRRIFEAAGTTLAVAALVVGVTAVLRITPKKSAGFVTQRPAGMALCTNDDLHGFVAYGGGPSVAIEYAWTSVRKACWVDDVIRLTITRNGSTDQFDAGVLPIQGNGSTIRLRGVVPAVGSDNQPTPGSNVLGVRWEWTNWCGDVTNPWFDERALNDASSSMSSLGHLPSNATCTDRSKPSVLRPLGNVTEMVEASPFAH